MALEDTVWSYIPKIGEGVSWVIQNIIQWLSSLGVDLTLLQAKILTLLIIGVGIYLVIQVINITGKFLKYAIIGALAFLLISVGWSVFI